MPIPTAPRKAPPPAQVKVPLNIRYHGDPLMSLVSQDSLRALFTTLIDPQRHLSPAQKRLAEYVMDAVAPTAESSLALYGSGRNESRGQRR